MSTRFAEEVKRQALSSISVDNNVDTKESKGLLNNARKAVDVAAKELQDLVEGAMRGRRSLNSGFVARIRGMIGDLQYHA